MRKLIILAAFLLFSLSANANNVSLSFGPSLDGSLGNKKLLVAAYEFQWDGPSLAIEAGGLSEQGEAAITGALNGYVGVNPGIHVVTPSGLSARIGFGAVCFAKIDDRLSSLPEFHIQGRAGYASKGYEAGVGYDHFSNGGIWPNNPGIDAIALYVGIPL